MIYSKQIQIKSKSLMLKYVQNMSQYSLPNSIYISLLLLVDNILQYQMYLKVNDLSYMVHFINGTRENLCTIEVFALWKKGLRRARPILRALATAGNQVNPLLSIRLYLPANLRYSF